MLAHRHRRRPVIKQALGESLTFVQISKITNLRGPPIFHDI